MPPSLQAERGDRLLRAGHDALHGELDRDVGLLLHVVHDEAGRLRTLIHVDAESVGAVELLPSP